MGRTLHQLTATTVAKLKEPGMHLDGGGLYLRVSATGSRGWIFRFKRRDMGLGPYPTVSLAEAREKAAEARKHLDAGRDPIEVRDNAAPPEASRRVMTFSAAAEAYVRAHETAWKNPKTAKRWLATCTQYAGPVIGQKAVGDVGIEDIRAILAPIWATKNETASKLRGRIEAVLDWAAVNGHRSGQTRQCGAAP
jgi:hypothetical protein